MKLKALVITIHENKAKISYHAPPMHEKGNRTLKLKYTTILLKLEPTAETLAKPGI